MKSDQKLSTVDGASTEVLNLAISNENGKQKIPKHPKLLYDLLKIKMGNSTSRVMLIRPPQSCKVNSTVLVILPLSSSKL